MAEDQVGVVVNFYAKPCVAAVKVTHGMIKTGDLLKYKRELLRILQKLFQALRLIINLWK